MNLRLFDAVAVKKLQNHCEHEGLFYNEKQLRSNAHNYLLFKEVCQSYHDLRTTIR